MDTATVFSLFKEKYMEATNYEILVVLSFILVFGSSFIHYRQFAKIKAKSVAKNEVLKIHNYREDN
jgi:hypothetical protein